MLNGINHITISVSDINTSFIFYKDVLGFKPVMKSDFSAYLLLSGIWIALQEEKNIDHQNFSYSHIAFNVDKVNFEDIKNKLFNAKVIEWKNNDTEGESFYFLDPSGNKFEIHYSNLETRIEDGKKNWKNVKWFI